MAMRHKLAKIVGTALIGITLLTAGPGGDARAQTPSLVQPWGLPPVPSGVGPVEFSSKQSVSRFFPLIWAASS